MLFSKNYNLENFQPKSVVQLSVDYRTIESLRLEGTLGGCQV